MGPIHTEWGYPARLRWWWGLLPWVLGGALGAALIFGLLLALAPWGYGPAGYPIIQAPDGHILTQVPYHR